MRRTILAGLTVVAALALGSCGAARPAKYYTLEGTSVAAPAANPYPISLLVGRITAPHLFRDDRIVYGAGPVQLGTYEYHRWAEPPTDMVENLLIQTLRNSGHYRSVERVSSTAKGDYILRGNLGALQEVDTPAVAARIEIELELFQSKTGTTVWSQVYSHDHPVTPKGKKVQVPEIVEALDKNLQTGLEQLSVSLAQYFAAQPPQSQ